MFDNDLILHLQLKYRKNFKLRQDPIAPGKLHIKFTHKDRLMNLTNYQGALKSMMLYMYSELNLYMLNKKYSEVHQVRKNKKLDKKQKQKTIKKDFIFEVIVDILTILSSGKKNSTFYK